MDQWSGHSVFAPASRGGSYLEKEQIMRSIIYLVGLVVIVLAIVQLAF